MGFDRIWGLFQLKKLNLSFLLSLVTNNYFCWILAFLQFHKAKFLDFKPWNYKMGWSGSERDNANKARSQGTGRMKCKLRLKEGERSWKQREITETGLK